jgi:hypothetical protein
MRWEKKKEPREGVFRIKRGFLFFPKSIKGEWRWLERAVWQEVYITRYMSTGAWEAVMWL